MSRAVEIALFLVLTWPGRAILVLSPWVMMFVLAILVAFVQAAACVFVVGLVLVSIKWFCKQWSKL